MTSESANLQAKVFRAYIEQTLQRMVGELAAVKVEQASDGRYTLSLRPVTLPATATALDQLDLELHGYAWVEEDTRGNLVIGWSLDNSAIGPQSNVGQRPVIDWAVELADLRARG